MSNINPYTGFEKSVIEADPVLELAWTICQIQDDDAPLRWHRHKMLASYLLSNYDIKDKPNRLK